MPYVSNEARNVHQRERYARERAERLRDRVCGICGLPIPVEAVASKKYCSPPCLREATRLSVERWARAHGKSPRGSPEHVKKSGDARRRAYAEGRNRPHASRTCRGCEIEFRPIAGNQRFCTTECQRRATVATKHKITLPELMAIYERQGGVCALCGAEWGGWTIGAKLHVDHDHKTGKVRGFLCGDCNTALGRFGDDPDRLRAAIAYLEGGTSHA